MQSLKISALALAILAVSSASVNAAEPAEQGGRYVGISTGFSEFRTHDFSLPTTDDEEFGASGKVYAGYRFNRTYGVEAGFAHLGTLSETVQLGGARVEQKARAHGFYAAATGRMPLGESFALTGKLGVSFGKVRGTDLLPASSSLMGSQRSLLVNLGAEYRLTPNLAFTVDYDRFGKLSDRVSAELISTGVRYDF